MSTLARLHASGKKLYILVNNVPMTSSAQWGQLDDGYVRKVLTGNTHNLVTTMEVLFRKGFIQPNSRILMYRACWGANVNILLSST